MLDLGCGSLALWIAERYPRGRPVFGRGPRICARRHRKHGVLLAAHLVDGVLGDLLARAIPVAFSRNWMITIPSKYLDWRRSA